MILGFAGEHRQSPPTGVTVEMGTAVSESGLNPTSDLQHLCHLGCVRELSWISGIKWGRHSPHHGTAGRLNAVTKARSCHGACGTPLQTACISINVNTKIFTIFIFTLKWTKIIPL